MSTGTRMAAKPQQVQNKRRRVFLVDDQPIVRQGLALFINREPDLTVCGEADTGYALLRAITEIRPDIVILDLALNGADGMELLKTIRLKSPALPILMFSMHDESTYAERTLRAGANGYVMKLEAVDKVLAAIRQILAGEVYVSDRLTKRMLQHFMSGLPSSRNSSLQNLSDRELEVFRLIGGGHGTRQIAGELHISIKTVESYQAHIKEKLALRNARELVRHAIEWSVSEK